MRSPNNLLLSLQAKKLCGNLFLIIITILILCFKPTQAAIEFDGVNDYIEIPNSPSLNVTNGITLSAWVYPNSTYNEGILMKGPLTNNQGVYSLIVATAGIGWYFRLNGSVSEGNGQESGGSPQINQWQHIIGTWNGKLMSLYVDNIHIGSSTYTTNLSTVNDSLKLGAYYSNSYTFPGLIDDVRIYNRSVSTSEIASLYNSRSKRSTGSLANGLVAHYEMDDDAIGEITAQAKDSSGNLNHGQFIGFENLVSNGFSDDVPTFIGAGHCLKFDGFNDNINVTDHPSLKPNSFTVMAWIKINATNSYSGIIDKFLGTNGYQINIDNSGRLRFDLGHNGSYTAYIGNSNLEDGIWHLVAASYDGKNGALFVDGIIENGFVNSNGISHTTDILRIGNDAEAGGRFFNGLIDDVRIYNGALTASEISFLYNGSGLDPGISNLQALWTFDDDSALKDSSGNSNHGVGVGGGSLKYMEGILKR